MKETTKKDAIFILKSVFLGIIIYALFALFLAFIKIYFWGSQHPHNMDGVFLIVFPLLSAPIGLVIGLIASIIYLKTHQLHKVIKVQCIGLVLLVILFIIEEMVY